MTLTLNMLRCPDAVPPQTRSVTGGEFAIGRGAENDWVLPDPQRVLSKRHCLLAYRSGAWQIADVSTNGTFLNSERAPIGHGQPRDLRDGDRLRLGSYEIEVRIVETEPARHGAAATGNPFALDPFASPKPATGPLEDDPLLRGRPEGDPFAPDLVPPSINLPPDYDPLAPEAPEAPFAGPIQPDHSPHLDDAFRPAAVRPVLPEDWDREPAPPPGAVAQPVRDCDREPARAPPGAVPQPVQAHSARPAPATCEAPTPEPPSVSPPPAGAVRAGGDELLAAFLRGAGLPAARPVDAVAAMEALGAAFRALVSGLRMALIARSAIKGEFRIEQTMIRSRGNNPLKFSADDDDALIALLGAGRRAEMGPAEAVADALRDMRLHEIATVAAMRSAVQALVARFEPAKLRLAAEQGGLNLVPLQRKSRAWDAFEALYAQTAQSLADDFDSVFGKAFARAYERALLEASAKEPPA
jgi:type VI secretion system protein ImpI/type VI secretion system protein